MTTSRWRRRLLLLGLLPLLAALLLTAKVAVMLHQNHAGREAVAEDRLAQADRAFGLSGLVNVLEPWVATYDRGTTAYLSGEYAEARRRLEEALRVVPAEEECRVRINLALAHEALGDAARADGDLAAARDGWTAGRRVLADGGCVEDAEAPAEAAPVDRRLAEKLVDTERTRPEEDPKASPPDDDPEATELEERNQRGETVRRDQEPPPSVDGGPIEYHW